MCDVVFDDLVFEVLCDFDRGELVDVVEDVVGEVWCGDLVVFDHE